MVSVQFSENRGTILLVEQAHHVFKRNTNLSSNGLYVSSGIVAGLVEAVLCLTPMQNLSLKLTHEAALRESRYSRSFFSAAWRITKESGVRGMLRGAGPLCIKNSMNQAIRFPTFYWLTARVREHHKERKIRIHWKCSHVVHFRVCSVAFLTSRGRNKDKHDGIASQGIS